MRILADLHHGQLYKSHELEFEKRLGYELMRPIGRKWYDECGYWGFTDVEATIEQYLGHPNLLEHGLKGKGIGRVMEYIQPQYHHLMITYDVFMSMHFDVLIASIPQHVPVFQKISREHPSRPKVIFQMGNMWTNYPRDVKNILNATSIPIDKNIHHLNYSPEFEVEFCRRDIPPLDKSVSSFLHINRVHAQDMFVDIEKQTGWTFKEYGAQNREGWIPDDCAKVTEKMLQSQFIWHVKRGGEGYGFIIHQAFAAGRPPIVNYGDTYVNQRAGEFMKPGVNCIDVCGKATWQIVEELAAMYPRWTEASASAKNEFEKRVDFVQQGEAMKKFLEELV